MHPRNISIENYSYLLPEDKIARYPLADRDQSRLLIYKDGNFSESTYRHIASHIPPLSLMVFNDTKVIEARLNFKKPTGGIIEIFCLEPDEQYADIASAMSQQGRVFWKCLVGGASKWKKGQVLEKEFVHGGQTGKLQARYVEKRLDEFVIELSWEPKGISFAEVIHDAGAIPLPPYIKRAAEARDAETYQTIYSHYPGSVAAPTAGLHFTKNVFEDLAERNIETAFLTLHVGAGTFKPVKAETMAGHEMHAEFISVPASIIRQIRSKINNDVIAVGTTSLRTIESLYWFGVKLRSSQRFDGIPEIKQWDPYDYNGPEISPASALDSLLEWIDKNSLEQFIGRTQIIIAPGYSLKIAKGLATNFHQPGSTLLLLVAAVIGNDWRSLYQYALENDFRFLSYGDGCLLWTGATAATGK